jgi:hypothetical protein
MASQGFEATSVSTAIINVVNVFRSYDLVDSNSNIILTSVPTGLRKLNLILVDESFAPGFTDIIEEFCSSISCNYGNSYFQLKRREAIIKINKLSLSGTEADLRDYFIGIEEASGAFRNGTRLITDVNQPCDPPSADGIFQNFMDAAGGVVGAAAGGGVASIVTAGVGAAGASYIAERLEFAWSWN